MKYAVEVDSGAMMYMYIIPKFTNVYKGWFIHSKVDKEIHGQRGRI
jgi:hypothetical protein